MNPAEAANVIAQVCNKWQGTIAEGDLIKQAYQTLTAAAGVDQTAVTAAAPPDEPAKPPTPNRAARRKAGPTKARAPSGK